MYLTKRNENVNKNILISRVIRTIVPPSDSPGNTRNKNPISLNPQANEGEDNGESKRDSSAGLKMSFERVGNEGARD